MEREDLETAQRFPDTYTLTFLGKTIIPFCAHGTGGLSRTVRDIRRTLPNNVKVLDAIGIYRPEVRNSRNRIVNWVKGLSY